jgi:Asp-tRNAAsn/Glu-tRNAGln amidotransferase B subunit (PET112 homolog)
VTQATVHFDPATGGISVLRSKEEAHDYRYFPEPDLMPIELEAAYVERVRAGLPELPAARKERLMLEHGLTAYDAGVLSVNRSLGEYFERVAGIVGDGQTSANWVTGDFAAYLNTAGLQVEESVVSPESLAELLGLVGDSTLSGKMAKEVFAEMTVAGRGAKVIVEESGLGQISDTGALEAVVAAVVAANPGPAEEFRQGRDKVFGFFVGQVMKETKGQANPQMVNELLRRHLARSSG